MHQYFIKLAQEIIDSHWANYDTLKDIEQTCLDPAGKTIYQRGQLKWKTRALIVEDNLFRLKELNNRIQ